MNINKITIFSVSLFFLVLSSCKDADPKEEATTFTQVTTGNPAIDGLSAKIVETPNDPGLYAERAKLYYESEGYDEAITDLQKALSLDSTNVTYQHLLADVYLDYYKSNLALKTMQQAAEMHPERIPTLLKLCEFQLILRQYAESMKTIARVLELDSESGDAYFMFGMNYKELGDTNRAINSFQTAVELNPDLIDGWINLGKLHTSINSPIAGRFFETALRIDPNNVLALHAQADYYTEQNRLMDAIEVYKKINIIDQQYEQGYFNSALIYMDLDSIAKAQQLFDLTIKVDPLHVRAYYYRGISSEMLGETQKAKADYQQVLKLSPDYNQAKEALARLQ